jgi:heme/copper-type cytochrome/quinol oxidase subunit 1
VFFVAGALGLLMRQSQADLARVGDNFFYAAMTSHGLGAFVAWAGFAVMGFGFWVLRSVGFAIRPLGYRLGDVASWAMVVGTAGIVASTLFLGFAGPGSSSIRFPSTPQVSGAISRLRSSRSQFCSPASRSWPGARRS